MITLTLEDDLIRKLILNNKLKFIKGYSIDGLFLAEYETEEFGKIIRSQLILDNGQCLTDNWTIDD